MTLPAALKKVWRWSFFPSPDKRSQIASLPVPQAHTQYNNLRGAKQTDRLVTYESRLNVKIKLFEGNWKVKIETLHSNNPNSEPRQTFEFDVMIEDILIVQLGDSYSSGEGAPEFDKSGKMFWGENGNGQNIQPKSAHRSSLTWGSLAAQRIEMQDDTTSVTFLNFAVSGALIDDIPSQLNELRNVVGNGPIDVVFMSIGGNDAGFANAIAAYILREPIDNLPDLGPSLDDIKKAIKTGNWVSGDFEDVGSVILEIFDFLIPYKWKYLRGLNNIASGYMEIVNQFDKLGINRADVYILQYPDPFMPDCKDPNKVCESQLTSVVENGGRKFEVGKKEQRHAKNNFMYPLNDEIDKFAGLVGWHVIPTERTFCGSAICKDEGVRSIVRYKESKKRQGDNRGSMHPNKDGYWGMGKIAYETYLKYGLD